jgi:hypothetical protein
MLTEVPGKRVAQNFVPLNSLQSTLQKRIADTTREEVIRKRFGCSRGIAGGLLLAAYFDSTAKHRSWKIPVVEWPQVGRKNPASAARACWECFSGEITCGVCLEDEMKENLSPADQDSGSYHRKR